jgi:hypothetical protein
MCSVRWKRTQGTGHHCRNWLKRPTKDEATIVAELTGNLEIVDPFPTEPFLGNHMVDLKATIVLWLHIVVESAWIIPCGKNQTRLFGKLAPRAAKI